MLLMCQQAWLLKTLSFQFRTEELPVRLIWRLVKPCGEKEWMGISLLPRYVAETLFFWSQEMEK